MSEDSATTNAPRAGDDSAAYARRLYPDLSPEPFMGPGDYQPLLDSLGEVILQVSDKDTRGEGDTRVVYQRGDAYGLLVFGWGSCSGCDALAGCETYQDIADLRAKLEASIRWQPAAELLAYVETHDWEGDYSWHDVEGRQFAERAAALLRERVGRPRAS